MKTLFLILLTFQLFSCQKDNSKSIVDKNIISEILEKQKLLENEETENKYTLSENDLNIVSDLISNDLKNKGYKFPTSEEFNNKIQTFFSINTKCIEYENAGSRFIVFHGNIMDGSKSTLHENLYESYADTENLFFDKKNLLILNFSLLKSIVIQNGQNISINIPQNIIARNKYLFDDSKADYTWLKFNDSFFLEELVKRFGYVKDEDLNLFIMDKNISNADEFGKILWNKECDDSYIFHKEIFNLISKADEDKKIKYLRIISDYLVKEIKDKNSELNTNPVKKAEILGKIAYYSTKIGEKNNMYYDFFSILGSEDGGVQFESDFKKNNYYGISDFKQIWEETRTGGTSSPGEE